MSNFDEYLQNIHDINLSYLLLAQQLIRQDKFAAGFRLGLSEGTIDNLKELSLPQLMKLATTNQLICRLRVDNEVVIENLTKDSRIEALQQIHTGIILSTNLLNALSEEEAVAAEGA
ncbi:flagellar transcriptional regulator FlhD [Enterobacter cloacae]|uniref:flagellar transcriptional regulator FlhD n=1 Tax=Enterobacter sp. BIDMC 26 TaxID=1329838 RepID=UPI000452944C|nr:flagellar transcriptional regulator FlhD [Enterobacter sp. BIDMC 26]ELH0000669.1 flagellar transcriptional regulator FlhD [Enterobacter cloacae]EUM24235.1 flagellar transcriptional activator FlhD [Enterobacter sp. BIDMC 26]